MQLHMQQRQERAGQCGNLWAQTVHRQYFALTHTALELQEDLQKTIESVMPTWNEVRHQEIAKAQRRIGDDDERDAKRRKIEAETIAFEAQMALETQALQQRLAAEEEQRQLMLERQRLKNEALELETRDALSCIHFKDATARNLCRGSSKCPLP